MKQAPDGKRHRIYGMRFGSVYPAYVNKVERKGHTKDELDTVITWLTGYEGKALQDAIDGPVDFETFFAEAPALNPNREKITGRICGVKIEEIEEPLMREIRYLDKLVDEVAQGKKMEKILRS